MPSADEHREWAASNETFYGELGGQNAERPDWAFTALFYVAVHEIKAFLVDHRADASLLYGHMPKNHTEIKAVLRDTSAWKDLGKMYERFLSQSKRPRYKCHSPLPFELQLAERQVSDIRAEIQRLG